MDLRQRPDLLSLALDEAYNAVMVTSPELELPGPRILYVNPAFERLTGYRADELQGRTPRILQGPESERAVLDRLRARLKAGETFEGATTNYRKDGTPFVMEWTVSPVADGRGGVEFFLAIQRDITRRVRAEAALAEQEAHYRDLVENYPDFVMRLSADGTITFANATLRAYAEEVQGIPAGGLEGGKWLDLLPEERRAEAEEHLATFTTDRPIQVFEAMLPNPAGEDRFIRWTHSAFFDDSGRIDHFQSVGADLTERRKAERDLRLSASVFDHASEGIMIADANGDLVAVNPAFTAITGYSEEEVLGHNPRFLQSGYQDADFYAAMWHAVETAGRWTGEIWNRRKDGRIVREWLTITAVHDQAGAVSHYLGVFSDISELRDKEEQLRFLANQDPLTHAANRRMLDSSLHRGMARVDREGGRLAVLVVDVDGFKRINDGFGHSEGDAVLMEVVARLSPVIRAADTLARHGGDEFSVILEGLQTAEAANQMAQRLIAAMQAPFRVANRDISLSASIGISVYPDDAADGETLFHNADMAMFEAKQAGGGAIRYYRAEMTRRAQERVLLEEDLRRGIDRDQLELHFQTQNRLADGSVAGLEALVRWNHPEQGRLGPDRFIPLAEENGLITAVTKWVARNACRQGRRWLDAGMDFGRLSLNISAVEFRRMDLPGCVRQTLADTGFPADRLILEVTESALAEPDETVLSDLRALQGLGVKLAVDDFGTGYSSLAYLKALPIDALKIDKGFVAGLPDDEHDLAIVRTVLAMGEAMGLEVIAEGIETEAHREFLTEAGCRVGQGFYWGRPSPTPLEALD